MFYMPWEGFIPWWVYVLSMVTTILMGYFFGYYPARKASQLDPINAINMDS